MNDATPNAALAAAIPDDLPAALLLAALLALPTSIGLLIWLRRALSRAAATSPAESNEHAAATLVAVPASSFSLADLRGEPCPREILEAGRDAWVRPWQSALVYSLAGAAFAAITTAAWRTSHRAVQVPLLFWTFFWPAVIAVNLVAGTTPATRRGVVAAYFAVFAGIAAFGLARDPDLAWRDLATFWLLVDALPTALLAIFLARRLRAVGPLVFAFLLASAGAAQLAIGDDARFEARFAAVALVAAVLGWPLLRATGALYARRRSSDQSLLVAAVWLSFGVVYALAPGDADRVRAATCAAAFAGYLLVARLGRGFVRRMRRGALPKQLLLLRATAARSRSESLFDALARHWLHVGGVARIANADAPETRDLLALLQGRNAAAGAMRDRAADPDGRFRVEAFPSCAQAERRMPREVAARSDPVLVDVRRAGAARADPAAELEGLLDAADLARVVFVVADGDDQRLLETTLARCWTRLAPDSPNRRPGAHVAHLVGDPADSPAALRALLGILAS